MHDCHSKYIISFYGAFLSDPNICICMEFMDKGSLDGIYKKIGAIDIDVVGHVALAVLEGLTYLYDVHRIIHRGECFHSDRRSRGLCAIGRLKTSNHRIFCATRGVKSRSVILEYQVNSSIPSPIPLLVHQHI
jgi:hypothetical protein